MRSFTMPRSWMFATRTPLTRRAPLNIKSTTRAGRIRKSGLFHFFPCLSTSWRCRDCSPPKPWKVCPGHYGRLELDIELCALCSAKLPLVFCCTCFRKPIYSSFDFMEPSNIGTAGMTGSWRTVFASTPKTTANWPAICVGKPRLLSV